MSELKPCPFCGSADVRITRSLLLRDPPIHLYGIACRHCDATVGMNFISEEAAKEAWNRRASNEQSI